MWCLQARDGNSLPCLCSKRKHATLMCPLLEPVVSKHTACILLICPNIQMTDEQMQPELLKYHLVVFQILCIVHPVLLSFSLYGVKSNCKISIVTQTLCCFNDHEGCVVFRDLCTVESWGEFRRVGSSVSLSLVFSGSSSELELDKVNGRKICTYDIRTRNEKASCNTMYIYPNCTTTEFTSTMFLVISSHMR